MAKLYSAKVLAMRKLYLLCVALTVISIFSSCSKDAFKPYEDRIIGTWRITDIDVRGFGGGTRTLQFSEGQFTFTNDRKLQYVNLAGRTFTGNWDLRKEIRIGNCYTDSNGNRNCTDERVQVLQLTAVDFTNQEIRSEYFDDIQFTNTNRMNGYIYSGSRTYVIQFVRL